MSHYISCLKIKRKNYLRYDQYHTGWSLQKLLHHYKRKNHEKALRQKWIWSITISYMMFNIKSCNNFWKPSFHEKYKMSDDTKKETLIWMKALKMMQTYKCNLYRPWMEYKCIFRIDIWHRWVKSVPKMLHGPSDNGFIIRNYSIMQKMGY